MADSCLRIIQAKTKAVRRRKSVNNATISYTDTMRCQERNNLYISSKTATIQPFSNTKALSVNLTIVRTLTMKQRLLALALISVLAACGGQTNSSAPAQSAAASGAQPAATAPALDSVLAEPKVGDLYAAKLSSFSDQGFGQDGKVQSVAYGLMKVVEV